MQSVHALGFRKLLAWQHAHALTLLIYQSTSSFPRAEQFGLISQMRRASSSIGAQIAEGSRMPTQVHRKLYYDRAYASAAELDNFLELAHDLKYLDEKERDAILVQLNNVSALLYKLSLSCNPSPP